MKKNQERRLHRKNAKIVKEGGTPMQLNRPLKPDTTVRYRFVLGFRDVLANNTETQTSTETLRPLRADGSYEYVSNFLSFLRTPT